VAAMAGCKDRTNNRGAGSARGVGGGPSDVDRDRSGTSGGTSDTPSTSGGAGSAGAGSSGDATHDQAPSPLGGGSPTSPTQGTPGTTPGNPTPTPQNPIPTEPVPPATPQTPDTTNPSNPYNQANPPTVTEQNIPGPQTMPDGGLGVPENPPSGSDTNPLPGSQAPGSDRGMGTPSYPQGQNPGTPGNGSGL